MYNIASAKSVSIIDDTVLKPKPGARLPFLLQLSFSPLIHTLRLLFRSCGGRPRSGQLECQFISVRSPALAVGAARTAGLLDIGNTGLGQQMTAPPPPAPKQDDDDDDDEDGVSIISQRHCRGSKWHGTASVFVCV